MSHIIHWSNEADLANATVPVGPWWEIIENDPVLPSQFDHDSRPDAGERRLLWAILVDAMALAGGASSSDRHRSLRQREALTWIESDARGDFDITTICEHLGLSLDRIRRLVASRQVRRPYRFGSATLHKSRRLDVA